MREIKFRAWDKTTGTIFCVGGFVNMDYSVDSEYRYVTVANGRPNDKMDATPQIQTIELMQYTGLKDKNGVEIYEGDIVREEGINLLRWVEYSPDDGAMFVLKADHYTGVGWHGDDLEVIGNIYENPELLEDKK